MKRVMKAEWILNFAGILRLFRTKIFCTVGLGRRVWKAIICSMSSFKGNPNSQGIFNWIIQILHYYRRKQHKISKTQIIEQNLVISLPFFLFTAACASFAFLSGSVFSVLGHSKYSVKLRSILTSQVIIREIYSFVFWFENGSL